MPRNPFVSLRVPPLPAALASDAAFQAFIEASAKEIRLISARKTVQYNISDIPKRGGGYRTIAAPNERLKFLQSKIRLLLSEVYRPRNCVHGYVGGRSALSNAQEHLGRPYLVKIDLKDFFGQITERRVLGLLCSVGVDRTVALQITRICTLNGCLPQGAPSSPLISNMVAFSLDNQLMKYCGVNRLRYGRYADDISISSYSPPNFVLSAVAKSYSKLQLSDLSEEFLDIFKSQGFDVNDQKMYFSGRSAKKYVTGYTINELVNVPRRHVRRVRAILHNVEVNGYAAEQRRFAEKSRSLKSLKQSLRGQIEWIGFAKGKSDPVYRRYAIQYNRLFSADMVVGPDFSDLVLRV